MTEDEDEEEEEMKRGAHFWWRLGQSQFRSL